VGGGLGVAELIGFAALYRALAVGAMSVVAPVSATAALVPLIVGVAAGDAPTAVQALGIALALGGAALASAEPGRQAAAGIGLALVAALGFGLFFVGMDVAADGGALWATSLNRTASLGVVVAALLVLRPPCPIDRAAIAPLAAVGVLDIAANAMFAVALTLGMGAIVSVLGSLYPLATVVLARAVLGEHVSGSQRTGVAAAIAGIGLVSFA
jgi:drug/metabolite transporter (DMT)-like permease